MAKIRAGAKQFKPVYQTEFGDKGNCCQAAIASILGKELDEVPNFIELYPGKTKRAISDFWDAIEDYFFEQGYQLWSPPLSIIQKLPDDVYYLAVGNTNREFTHMVVNKGSELHHDPHPDGDGLLEHLMIYLLTIPTASDKIPFDDDVVEIEWTPPIEPTSPEEVTIKVPKIPKLV